MKDKLAKRLGELDQAIQAEQQNIAQATSHFHALQGAREQVLLSLQDLAQAQAEAEEAAAQHEPAAD